jgi:acetyl esterase/lipase
MKMINITQMFLSIKCNNRQIAWLIKLAFVLLLATYAQLHHNAIAQITAPANQVGFWYNPSEPGWGLSIQQQGTRTFAVWFTYDAQRKPIWHTLECGFTNNLCAGDTYTGRGLSFAQITGAANLVAIKSGVASLTLVATNRINLTYTLGNITQTKLGLEPQNFAEPTDIPVCKLQSGSRANVTNYTDHWWGGQAQSGWGVQISHQANTVFFGWYSYNDEGSATWNTGVGQADTINPNRFVGQLYRIPEGVAFSDPFSASQPPTLVLGSFILNFTNGEAGAFTYTLPSYGVQNRTLLIERFALAGGPTTVCEKKSASSQFAQLNLAETDITPSSPAPLCNTSAPTTLSYVVNGAPAQKLDLYLPNTSTASLYPTIVWIHGGGWIMGDKADVGAVKRLVCRGYAVASINYRLSGTAKFPAQIYDVKAAIRYLRANAATYNLDANRFASLGSSAGGHLAALVSTSGGVADLEDLNLGNATISSHVQASVIWYGPSDFAQMDAQAIAQGCGTGAATHGRSDSPESNLLGCTVNNPNCAAAIRRANPATYINTSTAQPPMLLMHGTQDCTVPNAQSRVVKTAMDNANRCAINRNVSGAAHGGAAWDSAPVQDAVSIFLDAVLARTGIITCG